MKSKRLIVAVLACSTLLQVAAQTPPIPGKEQRQHKCPQGAALQGRTILTQDAIKPFKLLKHETPDLQEMIRAECSPGRLVFELLVNEVGDVECIEALNVSICSNEVATQYEKAMKGWKYEPPVDKAGQAVACYAIVTIYLHAYK
jgi:hypothetical protein